MVSLCVKSTFQRLYIDFLRPYPHSTRDKKFVFLILDHVSKFSPIKTIPKATANTIMKFLEKSVFHMSRASEITHSDNWVKFRANVA